MFSAVLPEVERRVDPGQDRGDVVPVRVDLRGRLVQLGAALREEQRSYRDEDQAEHENPRAAAQHVQV